MTAQDSFDKLTPGPWRWVFLGNAGNYYLLGNDGEGPITHSAPDSADGRLKQAAPDLLEACYALIADETDSYCEFCRQHAPKDFDTGEIIGPIPHLEDCAAEMARAAIARATGEASET